MIAFLISFISLLLTGEGGENSTLLRTKGDVKRVENIHSKGGLEKKEAGKGKGIREYGWQKKEISGVRNSTGCGKGEGGIPCVKGWDAYIVQEKQRRERGQSTRERLGVYKGQLRGAGKSRWEAEFPRLSEWGETAKNSHYGVIGKRELQSPHLLPIINFELANCGLVLFSFCLLAFFVCLFVWLFLACAFVLY